MVNNPFDTIVPYLTMNTVWTITKVFYLIAFGVYIAIAFLVLSQVKQMAKTIVTGFEKPLIIASYVHFGLAVLAFILALMLL
jgi:hypothetical protein